MSSHEIDFYLHDALSSGYKYLGTQRYNYPRLEVVINYASHNDGVKRYVYKARPSVIFCGNAMVRRNIVVVSSEDFERMGALVHYILRKSHSYTPFHDDRRYAKRYVNEFA